MKNKKNTSLKNKYLIKRMDDIIKKEKLFEKVKTLVSKLKNVKIHNNKFIIVDPDDQRILKNILKKKNQ